MLIAGPRCEQQQHARGRNRVGEERQELLGRRVDPVEILDHQDQRLVLGRSQEARVQGTEGLAATGGGVHLLDRFVADGQGEQLAQQGESPFEIVPGCPLVVLDLRECRRVVVGVFET